MYISKQFFKQIMRLLGNISILLILISTLLIAFRLFPHPSLSEKLPQSTLIYDQSGKLLRFTLASDDRYRVWLPLSDISQDLKNGVMLHEDQWFFYHIGFNPISLIRGAWVSYIKGGQRQGGSTITMQLARMHWKIHTRTVEGKIKQLLRAIQLELFYSKKDILEAYLNYAPYGRNIESIGAASIIYFNKPANELSLPEALTLSVLPQSPSLLQGGTLANSGQTIINQKLTRSRNRLYQKWLTQYPQDNESAYLFSLPLLMRQPEQLPKSAPHFTVQAIFQSKFMLDIDAPNKNINKNILHTTLDKNLQELLEKKIHQFIASRHRQGIKNASALLIDTRDMGIKALVGSANHTNLAISGQVNGTNAKRSPGSTLKPFIYALGLDQGIIHPLTVLKDVPTQFGASYSPENFDGQFMGPVNTTSALIRSRNIPAVTIASQLKSPSLYDFLKQSGVKHLAKETHYGLSLALGGGEITAQELAVLYGMLANHGQLHSLRFFKNTPLSKPITLLSPEASFITLDMLSQNPRPSDALIQPFSEIPIQWKTGTSWGFRDAWSAGIMGNYVLIVWIGNFDGKGHSSFIGGQSAAPLFFSILDSIKIVGLKSNNFKSNQINVFNMISLEKSEKSESFLLNPTRLSKQQLVVKPKPNNIKKVDVCLASGGLPTIWCPRIAKTWFIPGVSPIQVDSVYRPVMVDKLTGKAACAPFDLNKTHAVVYEFWSSDLLDVYALAGISRRPVPDQTYCKKTQVTQGKPKITSPNRNTIYYLRTQSIKNNTQTVHIPFNAIMQSDSLTIYWFVDQAYIGSTTRGNTLFWQPIKAGKHQIRAIDDRGRVDSRPLEIQII